MNFSHSRQLMTLHAYDFGDVVPFARRLAFMKNSRFSLSVSCARHGKIKLRLSVSIGNTRHIHHFPINFMPHRIFEKLKIDKSAQVCFFLTEGLCVSAVGFLTFQVGLLMENWKGMRWRWNWHRLDGEQTVDCWNLCFYTFCVIWDDFDSFFTFQLRNRLIKMSFSLTSFNNFTIIQ